MTLPWTHASSRRRREIIQGVGEAQRPLRAMRTKARDSFVRALRDARRWLDELLIDPAQTIGSLAMREHKSERSIWMTVSLAFLSPVLAEAALGGSPSTRVQRQAPDRPANALVRAMARSGTARADLRFEPNSADPRRPSTARRRYVGAPAVSVQSPSIVQPRKRNFAGRDWRANSGAEHGRPAGIWFADRPQAR